MAKIKFTKNELKRQRDSLKQFQRYLPTLQLKKQQLQMKILEARKKLEEGQAFLTEKEAYMSRWVGLFADLYLLAQQEQFDFRKWITPTEILTDKVNIAGANVPVFKDIKFLVPEYDFYVIPFWVDQAIVELQKFVAILAKMSVIRKEIEILERELRITTQRVNLFEKIKIPECKENIRVIRIYLGDQMANAVGIGKVAKKKVELKVLVEMAA